MASISFTDIETARARIGNLMVAQLKPILRSVGLQVTGSKAVLQQRINNRLSECASRNDLNGFHELKDLLFDLDNHLKGDSSQQAAYTAGPRTVIASGSNANPSANTYRQGRLLFKDSPFYSIDLALTSMQEIKIRESTRDVLECPLKIPENIAARFTKGEQIRIMIFCAPEPISSFTKVDIAFPNQVEIKVNGIEVKANLRGLKQKPGSTRPADITDLVDKKASYENILTVTYALTTKKYYFVVNLVKQVKAEELVDKLRNRQPISKQQVVKEMVNKAQDSDIQATSSIMSLKCPLSTLRMDVPCRSTVCTHNQCYDALSFFQLQEQAPTWVCPVCNKSAIFDSILVDQYVEEILRSTTNAIEQVVIEPSGVWREVSHTQNFGTRSSSSSDDDDLVEILEPSRLPPIKSELSSKNFVHTPPYSSREQSTSSIIQRSVAGKRPATVIDLTLSDGEDETPPRPTKRQASNFENMETHYLQHPQSDTPSSNSSPYSFHIPRTGSRLSGSLSFGS